MQTELDNAISHLINIAKIEVRGEEMEWNKEYYKKKINDMKLIDNQIFQNLIGTDPENENTTFYNSSLEFTYNVYELQVYTNDLSGFEPVIDCLGRNERGGGFKEFKATEKQIEQLRDMLELNYREFEKNYHEKRSLENN